MVKKRLLEVVPTAKENIARVVLYQWIGLIGQVGFAMLLAWLIGIISQRTFTLQKSVVLLVGIGLAIGIRFFAEVKQEKASFFVRSSAKKELRQRIYQQLWTLGSDYQKFFSKAEVSQLLTEGVEQLEAYFGSFLPLLFYSVLAPITLFLVLLPLNFKASVVLLLEVPFIPLVIMGVAKIAKTKLRKYWKSYLNLGDSFLENLEGLVTLKIYQADAMKEAQMDREAEDFRRMTMKVLVMQLNSVTIMDIFAYGGAAVGMLIAIFSYAKGEISLFATLCVIFLASEFFLPMRRLGSAFHMAMNGVAASDRLFALLDASFEEKGSLPLQSPIELVEVNDLSFAYEVKQAVLKNICLRLKPGQIHWVMGPSGCGKTTLLKLLGRKERSSKGRIVLNGREVSQIALKDLGSQVAYVGQESYLFKGTIEENLRMGNEKLSDDELWQMLEDLRLAHFFTEKEGLTTRIDAGGENLSGGQRQRLLLGRALLKKASLYLLDEVTSSVDYESEQAMMSLLKKISQKCVVVLVSHRLTLADEGGEVYFLHAGQIIEEGNVETLLAKKGAFCHLYHEQKSLEAYSIGGEEDENHLLENH
ncbi:ABC transporter ATP-binding protein/permease [Aerococcus christensenii]|uniref:ABC transporter ATP-binding protein/permease n=1 Tax=Aerococcus christensenii TaxID=87541 RepID=UPI0023A979FE|nr:ABC transporter ATP-binding protein/permease [Aerococcus christensenii]WEB71287.1 ABC transporter ATP-binding protein/permease [Aerococcus christensenii]